MWTWPLPKKNIGVLYQNQGNGTVANAFFAEAHDIYLRSLGPDHPDTRALARFGRAARALPPDSRFINSVAAGLLLMVCCCWIGKKALEWFGLSAGGGPRLQSQATAGGPLGENSIRPTPSELELRLEDRSIDPGPLGGEPQVEPRASQGRASGRRKSSAGWVGCSLPASRMGTRSRRRCGRQG